jgi:hypothetical chaperone protein
MECFGLDFGTTNTSLSWARGEELPVLCAIDPPAPDPRVLRTLLYFSLEQRGFIVGQRAIDEYLAEDMQGTLIQSIKTFLADESFEETWIQDRMWTLEDLLAVPFRHARAAIRALTPDDVLVVVGRPAVFVERPEKEQLAQKRLRRAAERAGFGRIEFQYEPIAAGLAYEASLGRPELALIADLGGGTSDFTVMRLGTGAGGSRREDILATGGVQIGGDTFDARIMARKLASFFGSGTTYRTMEGRALPFPSRLLANLGHWHQVTFLRERKTRDLLARLRATSNEPDAVVRFEALLEGNGSFFLFEEIERAKSQLSREDEARIAFHLGTIDVDVTITRPEFEAMIAADLAHVAACMQDVLSRAGVGAGDVDAVFVTGGSAQVPAVRALFVDAFGADRLRAEDYLTTVACGLGLTAARAVAERMGP